MSFTKRGEQGAAGGAAATGCPVAELRLGGLLRGPRILEVRPRIVCLLRHSVPINLMKKSS